MIDCTSDRNAATAASFGASQIEIKRVTAKGNVWAAIRFRLKNQRSFCGEDVATGKSGSKSMSCSFSLFIFHNRNFCVRFHMP